MNDEILSYRNNLIIKAFEEISEKVEIAYRLRKDEEYSQLSALLAPLENLVITDNPNRLSVTDIFSSFLRKMINDYHGVDKDYVGIPERSLEDVKALHKIMRIFRHYISTKQPVKKVDLETQKLINMVNEKNRTHFHEMSL